jgi:enoyl-CoA hydratase/carnithine racemase/3-hydroxyacyl-CoA dehydrogenase
MAAVMRQPTLSTMNLGTVLDILEGGRLPASADELVDQVFGKASDRGSLVISGANGIVGAGKAMQLGSRLQPYDVRIVALDFPNAPDGIGAQYGGLARAFGPERAGQIMASIVRLTYDGKQLPSNLADYQPRFLIEAIPEILEIKKAHYEIFRAAFPKIEIRSVTSGFPSSQLGVGIAHPAFPHEINKVWEIVEPEPSAHTQLFWALGLIPVPVGDQWSFVLDVLFCGLTLAALRYHHASNMPYWKIDKLTRRLLGPNPFRAHDAIGAKGADFLTWSCLHHLSKEYGDVFTPTKDLDERKDSGQNWYPPNHFRPVVNWTLDSDEVKEFETWLLGPLCQMTSLMLHEDRAHLAHLNIIGELCALYRNGILAMIRKLGAQTVVDIVGRYHKLHPEAAKNAWYPDVFERVGDVEWQQLYVNAEHNGSVGVITIGRESYNADVDAELNRAIDWLKKQDIDRVIVTGDFHLATQMVGADTNEFFPALEDPEKGYAISYNWSRTARRLHDEFDTSVGFINGKRCLGGFLELMMHCHYLVSVDDAALGLPEVTLPVVPGMEGCHWPYRKTGAEHWPRLLEMTLGGRPVGARDAVGWLVDYAAPLDDAVAMTWKIANGDDHGLPLRRVEEGALKEITEASASAAVAGNGAAQRAIVDTIRASCAVTLADALTIQAKHSAGFMAGEDCRKGAIGAAFTKTMRV